jgi:hypothetical protein
MTFGEIYSRVCYKIWGSSAVPQGSEDVLVGERGIISECHRKIQTMYNFWFMMSQVSTPTVANVQAYVLPTDYKEYMYVQFKEDGEDYFRNPLDVLGVGQSQAFLWQSLNETAEYPTYFEIVGQSIVLYPIPSTADRYFHMTYWAYLPRPTDAGFDTWEDHLTDYGADVIINLAVSEMKEILEEYQSAQYYKGRFQEELEILKTEDRRRRQIGIGEVLMLQEGF